MAEPDLSARAGRYQRQPTGYRAFIPAPLPPGPPIRLEGELQALLSQADRALGRLDGSGGVTALRVAVHRYHPERP